MNHRPYYTPNGEVVRIALNESEYGPYAMSIEYQGKDVIASRVEPPRVIVTDYLRPDVVVANEAKHVCTCLDCPIHSPSGKATDGAR